MNLQAFNLYRRAVVFIALLLTGLFLTHRSVGSNDISELNKSVSVPVASSEPTSFVFTRESEKKAETKKVEPKKAETKVTTKVETETKKENKAPSFTVTELDATFYVQTESNVRSGPAKSYERIGGLSTNQKIKVTGKASTGWYRISYNGKIGYISDSLVASEPVEIEKPKISASGRESIPTYPAPSKKEQGVIDAILDSILTYDMNEFEIGKAIHDYLCAVCTYDSSYKYYTAYSCMVTGKSVCQGYANAYWRLMNAAGIPTDYVSGTGYPGSSSGRHAWNRSLINGTYYYTDVTWDDNSNGGWNYKYFMVSYEEISKDHKQNELNRKNREY